MLNSKKTIGAIVYDVSVSFQLALTQMLKKYALEEDYNLLYFTASTFFGYNNPNSKGERNIINLVPYEKLDALIIIPDTMYRAVELDEITEIYKRKKANCPVFILRANVPEYNSIIFSFENAIPDMVRHLHEVHGCTKIAYMGGPESHPDAVIRLEGFKDTMTELGLALKDEYYFEGDFWKHKGKEAADFFTKADELPEAIICANDYMALQLIKELSLLGYNVPADIKVTGFDDIADAESNIPSLTTCAVDNELMAKKTIESITRAINGEEVDRLQHVPTKAVYRSSCSCEEPGTQSAIVARAKLINYYESIMDMNNTSVFVSISLEGLTDVNDLGTYLQTESALPYVKELYICLGEKRFAKKYPKTRIKLNGYAQNSRSVYSYVDGEEIETSVFPTYDLLPKEAIKDEPMCVIFVPLHFLEYNYGYAAVIERDGTTAKSPLSSFMPLISNTIERLRIINERNEAFDKINALYNQDSLTGLYNRRGLSSHTEDLFASHLADKTPAMIMTIDIDNMKTINDNYGHNSGDAAIIAISTAITTASIKGTEIGARVGGDEFIVYASNYTEEDIHNFEKNFYKALDEHNNTSYQPYLVAASHGYAFIPGDDLRDLEYFTKLCDDSMYENKRKRKSKYGDLSIRK